MPPPSLRIGAVVQARLSSARLPGKVLRPIHGRPLIDWLLDRLGRSDTLDTVVVATSTQASDDPLADHCRSLGIRCHRGPLDDVCARLLDAADSAGIDVLVRISGDSPILDPAIVDRGVALWLASDQPDLVTNVFPRTFPVGQSVEIFARDHFRGHHGQFTERHHHEHVTPFLYENPERFHIVNFRRSPPYSGPGMCIDTAADAERVERVLQAMERPHWDYGLDELLELASRPSSRPGTTP